jgi:hypothetical protein
MYTIYIIDRANQLSQQTFSRQQDADDASDRWEEVGGCEVFTDRTRAIDCKDRYDRRMRAQSMRFCRVVR